MGKYKKLSKEEFEEYNEWRSQQKKKIFAVFLAGIASLVLIKHFFLTREAIQSIGLRYVGLAAYLGAWYLFLQKMYDWYAKVEYKYKANPIRRFFHRFYKNKLAVFGSFVALTIILMAIFAPLIATYDVTNFQAAWTKFSLLPPTKGHLFGATNSGADLFSLVVFGSRIALAYGVGVTLIVALIGIIFGGIAGYFGGWVDRIFQYINDVIMSFPFLVLILALIGALRANPSLNQFISRIGSFIGVQGKLFISFIALCIFGWTGIYRLVRGQVFSIREKEYIDAAKSLGASSRTIIYKHILRNAMAPVIVQSSLSVGGYMITAASLTYLGFGASITTPSWGRLLQQGNAYVTQIRYFHLTFFPGLILFMTVLAFTTLGDGLRDAIDPRMRE